MENIENGGMRNIEVTLNIQINAVDQYNANNRPTLESSNN